MDIFEIIDMHNEQVDKMCDLAETLMKTYPDVEGTSVNVAFTEVFNSLIPMAILLCCEANHEDPDGQWCTSDKWHVMPSTAFEDDETN